MRRLRITLAADGRSDRCLMHPIRWAITEQMASQGIDEFELDPAFAAVPSTPLRDRIARAVEDYPCDLLLVHRDAEGEPAQHRYDEIAKAFTQTAGAARNLGVVPIRMSEAWLLIDEAAIRLAVGNPQGHATLHLPPVQKLEAVSNPKALLNDALKAAAEVHGRRLARLKRDLPSTVQRVAELIEDFSLCASSQPSPGSKLTSRRPWEA